MEASFLIHGGAGLNQENQHFCIWPSRVLNSLCLSYISIYKIEFIFSYNLYIVERRIINFFEAIGKWQQRQSFCHYFWCLSTDPELYWKIAGYFVTIVRALVLFVVVLFLLAEVQNFCLLATFTSSLHSFLPFLKDIFKGYY